MRDDWVHTLGRQLPAHAETVRHLANAVESADRWRALVIGCSLAADRGDEFSDIDAGLAYDPSMSVDELERTGIALVEDVGEVLDVLVHTYPGWPAGGRRFAVEFARGVQLDLAAFPAPWRRSRESDVVVVDKDGSLAELVVPPAEQRIERLHRDANEWAMLGWWSVSNIAKYLRRGALHEATANIDEIRGHCCRLHAAAGGIPDPEYGLTTLLDFPPWELPDGIDDTYCLPSEPATVIRAARNVAELLADCTGRAAATLGVDLSTPWSDIARSRLAAALDPSGKPGV